MPRNTIAAMLLVACAPERGAEAEHASSAGPSSSEPVVVAATMSSGYDSATEIDVEGSVTRVREVESRRGWTSVHLDLAVGDAAYDVHVGPKFYLAEVGFAPKAGDQLHVLGSRRGGTPAAIIARQITHGEQTWTFRDERGRPLWRGRR
jgi:hypothetical protein